jgi:hypothetical protein
LMPVLIKRLVVHSAHPAGSSIHSRVSINEVY